MTTATLRGRVAICTAILRKQLDTARREFVEAQLAQYRAELADAASVPRTRTCRNAIDTPGATG